MLLIELNKKLVKIIMETLELDEKIINSADAMPENSAKYTNNIFVRRHSKQSPSIRTPQKNDRHPFGRRSHSYFVEQPISYPVRNACKRLR